MFGLLQKLTGLVFLSSMLLVLLHKHSQRWHPKIAHPAKNWLMTQHQRKAILNSNCLKHNLTKPTIPLSSSVGRQIFVEHNHEFIYCEVPKVGCSNWKRILLLLKMNLNRDPRELLNVHSTAMLRNLNSYPPEQQRMLLNNYTKVMFTRPPLERLVSAYRDKFLHNVDDKYYSEIIAKVIKAKIRKSRDFTGNVTFLEFVRYILQENPHEMDIHWKPMVHLCDPCSIQYDIIGKFETLTQDSDHVLKRIGAPEGLHFPKIRNHNTEDKTNERITETYLRDLNISELQSLLKIYHMDFTFFNYPTFQNTSQEH